MQAVQRRLDELVLDVLAPPPDAESSDDKLVTIELCDEDEFSTTQFVRADYDQIEIAPARPSAPRIRSTTYAQTVRVFDPAWFDRPVVEPAADIDAPRGSWWWLALSIAIAAAVVIYGSLSL